MKMGDDGRSDWQRRRERRRKRLRAQFDRSRRRHEPPPDPDHWEPPSTLRHIWQTLWDNPMGLLVLAIMVAILLYILFPPASLAVF